MHPVAGGPTRGMALPQYNETLRKAIPRPVLETVRGSVRRYGMLTAASRPLPDYLVIGTKKGGTSSLINWLVCHPNVARMFPAGQRLKSSHYFDINYHRGVDWYRSHFPTQRARDFHAKRVNGPVVVGEASPYYMFHPAAAQRARKTAPHLKIIALLRDPVARAYSNYWDRRASDTESLSTFEEAIDAEEQRLAGVDYDRLLTDPAYYSFHHDNHSYLARGRYLEHLSRWIDAFPPEQLLILQAEAMFTSPEEVFAQVQRFLDVPVAGKLDLTRFNERTRAPMRADTCARLVDYYRPYNAALYEALGQNFGWESRYS